MSKPPCKNHKTEKISKTGPKTAGNDQSNGCGDMGCVYGSLEMGETRDDTASCTFMPFLSLVAISHRNGRPTSMRSGVVLPNGVSNLMISGRGEEGENPKTMKADHSVVTVRSSPITQDAQIRRHPGTGISVVHVVTARPSALQIVLGVRALLISTTSSRWLHMATNRSKKSLPPRSISACMVPLLLNVLRHRMIRAR